MPSLKFKKNKKRRISAKKKRALRRKIFAYSGLLLVGLLLATFVQLSALESLNIRQISVKGNKELAWKVQNFLHEKIFSKNYYLFSPYNKLTLNESKLLAEALEAFPEIKSIEDRSANFAHFNLQIELRDPAFLYCKVEDEKKLCYFSDKDGFIFKKAKIDSSESPLPEIYLNEKFLKRKLKATLLQSQIANEYLEKVRYIVNNEKVKDLHFKEFHFFENGDLWVYSDTFYVKLRQDNVENINYLNFAIKNSYLNLDNLDYADLRFKSRIYYKEKQNKEDEAEE